ncbi:hypothetical protein LOD99_12566 [Oopsacas minuta]|uniref:RNA helicase n=1 Tax=Oopsacas minuta TaxID=111878 RepID=A0AAV7JD97_9METZ|nr:hypothetical protein LOD99_12566 [Oopsacas minuta]
MSNNHIKLRTVRIVPRSVESQLARRKLPIFSEEYQIMESIGENDVTIISGSTGSGKTTQVPQFLYEAGYADPDSDLSCKRGLICVTEPRRLAAVLMATRVAQEMGFSNSDVIGFQTRFNKLISPNTLIKFMTDGVLMKELESDFLLTSYSVVCLDEAHERSVYTDILIGILSRVVRIRAERNNPLKLVIMSATLRLEDFIENRKLFPVERIPPVIHIESRQYPVTIHFSRVTTDDYVTRALNKIIDIHLSQPLGTILVFLTSKREIYSLCDRIQSEYEKLTKEHNFTQSKNDSIALQILPLHAQLSTLEQSHVFTPIPNRTRRIVVSTNVAETSITIPDVKYVVDTGKVKRRLVDRVTGVSTFRVDWCSQASAEQRAGRAGRTSAGHLYRLYSSSVFLNEFPEHTQPDILQCPLDDLYLQMKCMNIQNVSNFPFPTPPDRELLESADILLCKLGALSPRRVTDGTYYSVPTSLGRNMNNLPIAPRLARILIEYSHSLDMIHYLICIISGLSTLDQVFSNSSRISPSYLKDGWMGDLMLILKIVCASDFEDELTTISDVYGINDTKIIEILKLRKLLTSSLNRLYPQLNLNHKDKLLPPDKKLQIKLCRAMLSGFGDHIANLSNQSENHSDSRIPVYECSLTSAPVYIYPFSCLYKKQTSIEWVAFIDIIESNKMYMRCLFPIELLWIPQVCDSYCTFSPPLQFPAPIYDSNSGVLKQFKQFSYHNMSWRFPPYPIQMSSSDIITYKLFAKAFLEGQVFESLLKYSQLLRYPTQCLVKPWGKYLKETENIVNTLRSKNVMSKVTIQNEWSTDTTFLFKEYCHWLPRNISSQLSTSWPPNS